MVSSTSLEKISKRKVEMVNSTNSKRSAVETDLIDVSLQNKVDSHNELLKRFLEGIHIVAGSYERLLYGLELTKPKNTNDSMKSDATPKSKKQRLLEAATAANSKSDVNLEPSYVYPAHLSCIKTLAANQRYLVSGSTDELVKVYDLKLRKEVGVLMHHSGSITCTEFFGKSLITASEDGLICILRTKDWEVLKTIEGHKHGVNSISIHPSGKLLLSGGRDSALKLWDLTNGQCAYQMRLKTPATKVLWSPKTEVLSGGDLYAVMTDKELTIQKTGTGKICGTITIPSISEKFTSMTFLSLDSLADMCKDSCLNKSTLDKVWVKETKSRVEELIQKVKSEIDEFEIMNSDSPKFQKQMDAMKSKLNSLLEIKTMVNCKSGLKDSLSFDPELKEFSNLIVVAGFESGKFGFYTLDGKLIISFFKPSALRTRVKDLDSCISFPKITDSTSTQYSTNIMVSCESDGNIRIYLVPEILKKSIETYIQHIENSNVEQLTNSIDYPIIKEDLVYNAKCRLVCLKIAPGLAKKENKSE